MSEAEQILQECASDVGCLRLPASAPFAIDVSLSGTWATLECNMDGPASPDAVARLHAVVRFWVDWVNKNDSARDLSNDGEIAQVSDPVSGIDFVQWHLQLYLAEPQRLNVLVNALVRLHHKGVGLSGIYIG